MSINPLWDAAERKAHAQLTSQPQRLSVDGVETNVWLCGFCRTPATGEEAARACCAACHHGKTGPRVQCRLCLAEIQAAQAARVEQAQFAQAAKIPYEKWLANPGADDSLEEGYLPGACTLSPLDALPPGTAYFYPAVEYLVTPTEFDMEAWLRSEEFEIENPINGQARRALLALRRWAESLGLYRYRLDRTRVVTL